jgi:hypothetical protein
VPDTEYVLHDIDEEQKESSHHGGKLDVAYVLVTPKGMPIQIMKNLRICGDCHTFIKFVSHVTRREIDMVIDVTPHVTKTLNYCLNP